MTKGKFIVISLSILFLNVHSGQAQSTGNFLDVAESAGLTDPAGADQGAGVSWGDYDGDGDLDVMVTNWQQPAILFRNNGGKFEDVTNKIGWEPFVGVGAVWGDYDSDGNLDLFVSNGAGAPHLFRNKGGKSDYFRFQDESGKIGSQVEDSGQGASWVDYDNDGDLDLCVVNYGHENRLFKNDNGGKAFQDVAEALGIADYDNSLTGIWGDYDNDGYLDLYVVNHGQPNRLYQNDRGKSFTPVGFDTGVNDGGPGTGAAWGDYDNDGDLDLYVVNLSRANRLYRNDGEGKFEDVGALLGVNNSGRGQNAVWGDYDNDGDLDLYLVNGGSGSDIDYLYENRIYGNDGGRFVNASAGSGLNDTGRGSSAAWADYDNDGDLDLFLVKNLEQNRLFENRTIGRNWVSIRLKGKGAEGSNLAGIGARIQLKLGKGPHIQVREVSAGSGYLSQEGYPVLFGTGDSEKITELTVKWPSGIRYVMQDVKTGKQYEIPEKENQDIDVTPLKVSFDSIETNTSESREIVISNKGEESLTIRDLQVNNPFHVSNTRGFTLAPAASRTIEVFFRPSSPGESADTLRIRSDDPDEEIKEVKLNGRAYKKPEIVEKPSVPPPQRPTSPPRKPTPQMKVTDDVASGTEQARSYEPPPGSVIKEGLEYTKKVTFGKIDRSVDPGDFPKGMIRIKNLNEKQEIKLVKVRWAVPNFYFKVRIGMGWFTSGGSYSRISEFKKVENKGRIKPGETIEIPVRMIIPVNEVFKKGGVTKSNWLQLIFQGGSTSAVEIEITVTADIVK